MVVVDPMCGEGTILLEAAKRYPVSTLLYFITYFVIAFVVKYSVT